MRAEIISVGSELTSGVSLDTNGQWLSARLAEVGIEVAFHTTVADDMEANVGVFDIATKRADLVLVTGGLGPTLDDLTREALAKVAGVDLVFDQPSFDRLQQIFQYLKRPMPERNRVQAYFPSGSTVVPNENGTAPGIWLEVGQSLVVCMPGVPREMKPMFTNWVLPRLLQRFGAGKVIVHRTLRCFGAGESHVEQMLGEFTKRGRHPEVGITVSEATISLRVTAKAGSTDEARSLIDPDITKIREILGPLVFGEEDDQLQNVVGRLLLNLNVTLSTAESCTGGMLGEWLTQLPGISSVYMGGVVSYANEAKKDLLGVSQEILDQHGAVSEECAAAMALGCQKRFHTDLAVSITGIAGPHGGTPEKPVGLVYVGLAHADGVKVRSFQWGADRESNRIRATKMALNMVRRYLEAGE
ncbi:competence/damage-inducible protein A [bacterium]|nr:competence/damage-inducible protein A [bacterium]